MVIQATQTQLFHMIVNWIEQINLVTEFTSNSGESSLHVKFTLNVYMKFVLHEFHMNFTWSSINMDFTLKYLPVYSYFYNFIDSIIKQTQYLRVSICMNQAKWEEAETCSWKPLRIENIIGMLFKFAKTIVWSLHDWICS